MQTRTTLLVLTRSRTGPAIATDESAINANIRQEVLNWPMAEVMRITFNQCGREGCLPAGCRAAEVTLTEIPDQPERQQAL